MNQQPPSSTDLTSEDLATIRRCRQESFWRRCVPMIVGASLTVGFANARGTFTNYPRLLFPSYFLAGVTGYLGGKLSYFKHCKQMFLELHDSRVKDFLQGNLPELPSPRRPDFGSPGGLRRSLGGSGRQDDGPVLVETPLASKELETSQHMTYAKRREFFRQQQISPPPPPSLQTTEPPQAPEDMKPQLSTPPSSSGYFDEERPLSSFLSDDTYRPND